MEDQSTFNMQGLIASLVEAGDCKIFCDSPGPASMPSGLGIGKGLGCLCGLTYCVTLGILLSSFG